MAVVIVPARLGSSRFPRKLLASETGKPLVQHVVEAAAGARGVERVVVAAEEAGVFREALAPFGTEVVGTGAHPNGTSRVGEAARALGLDGDAVVVNVQGDEPEIGAGVIEAGIGALEGGGTGVGMSTVGSPFADGEDPADPNIVKVVVGEDGRALYFSRALVPFDRDGLGEVRPLKHVGLYCYRVWMLERYAGMRETALERCERLEQLRVLAHGEAIRVAVVRAAHHGIDTEAQYRAFVGRRGASTG